MKQSQEPLALGVQGGFVNSPEGANSGEGDAVDWDFTHWFYVSGASDSDARNMFECLLACARREGRAGLAPAGVSKSAGQCWYTVSLPRGRVVQKVRPKHVGRRPERRTGTSA
jgi:hypothetical protein